MKVTYYENLTREITVDLEPKEEQMDASEIGEDAIIRDRAFAQAAMNGWDAEEVYGTGWEIDKYV